MNTFSLFVRRPIHMSHDHRWTDSRKVTLLDVQHNTRRFDSVNNGIVNERTKRKTIQFYLNHFYGTDFKLLPSSLASFPVWKIELSHFVCGVKGRNTSEKRNSQYIHNLYICILHSNIIPLLYFRWNIKSSMALVFGVANVIAFCIGNCWGFFFHRLANSNYFEIIFSSIEFMTFGGEFNNRDIIISPT